MPMLMPLPLQAAAVAYAFTALARLMFSLLPLRHFTILPRR